MKLAERRVLRDPIHGYIQIEDDVIWKLIDSIPMQRLKRIRQLGGVGQVYHTAEHSRFSHSLGVYEIFRRICAEVPGVNETLGEDWRTAGLCAALLHDLGHGPFSHGYEAISHVDHEAITQKLILDEKGDVCRILEAESPGLARRTAAILAHESECPLAEELISSQLDCDRMDYLLRDAYETGTSYGHFDLERILRTLRVKDGHLAVKKSGMHSVEDYIMARYQMYWQVYLHPDAYGYDLLVQTFFGRYKILRENPAFRHPLLEAIFEPFFPERFLELDDFSVLSAISSMQKAEDSILRDLAGRIVNRRLFGWQTCSEEASSKRVDAMLKAGYDPAWYFHIRTISNEEYRPYSETKAPIRILEGETILPLSQASVVVRSLLSMPLDATRRMYYPKDGQEKS